MTEQLQNFGSTTLNEALDDSETTVTVTDGSVLPSSGDYRVNCEDEIMLVTARTTNDLTVTRGAEGTAAVAHDDGTAIKAVLTADGLLAVIQENIDVGASNAEGGLGVIFDAPAAADTLSIVAPFDCTITGAVANGDVSGSAVVDVWKDTAANSPPTVADTIVASAPITLSSEAASLDETLTGWTLSVLKGDRITFSVTSVTTITELFAGLNVLRPVLGASDASGATFPTVGLIPGVTKFLRTDLDSMTFIWDGTRWVSETIFRADFHNVYANIPIADIGANIVASRIALPVDYDIFALNWHTTTRIATTNDGSNYWTCTLLYQPSSTSAGSFTTAAESPDTFFANTVALDDVVDTTGGTDILAQQRFGDTGSPGVIDSWESYITYRLIAT